MSKQDQGSTLVEQPAAEVDRIRDIIFGSQMRQYDHQFKRLMGHLDALNQKLEELRGAQDQHRADQLGRTRELQDELRQRHSEVEGSLSRLETEFGQKNAQMQEEYRQGLGELRNQAFRRIDQQGADLDTQMRQLVAELRQQDQDLRSEFTVALEALEDAKADRHAVGDLLIEVGMRLKQEGSLTDLLGQLAEAADGPPAE